MVWFHSLESMDEERASSKVDLPCFCNKSTLYFASWPKCMPHASPRSGWIWAKVTCAVLPNLEARCNPLDCKIDNVFRVHDGLDRVRIAGIVEGHGTPVCMEAELVYIEIRLIQGI